MEFTIEMGVGGAALLIIGALILGVLVQLVGEARSNIEWFVTGIAALAGAVVASEFVTAWSTMEPMWDQVALLPALVGGLVTGLVVAVVIRYATGGSLTHGPHAV